MALFDCHYNNSKLRKSCEICCRRNPACVPPSHSCPSGMRTPASAAARGALNLKLEAKARKSSVWSGACNCATCRTARPSLSRSMIAAGSAERPRGPLAGDLGGAVGAVGSRRQRAGPIWRFVVLLTGMFPLVFAVTSVIMCGGRADAAAGQAAANRAGSRGKPTADRMRTARARRAHEKKFTRSVPGKPWQDGARVVTGT
jgi:hypothetical protein